jgi:hypothetical protein
MRMSLLPCNIGVGEVQLDDLQCNYEGHNLVPSFPSPKKEEIEYNGKTFVPGCIVKYASNTIMHLAPPKKNWELIHIVSEVVLVWCPPSLAYQVVFLISNYFRLLY